MNLGNILKRRNRIYGICSIWIILFHVLRKMNGEPYIPVVTDIISIGNAGVDIFLFLSGVSLSLSAARNNYSESGWKEYFKKRIARLLLPYLVIAVPGYLWSAFTEHSKGSFLLNIGWFIWNSSSGSFWLKGADTTWFVFAIAIFYILFPCFYECLRTDKRTKRQVVYVFILMTIAAIVLCYAPIFSKTAIVWSRLPIFCAGIIFGTRYDAKENKPYYNWISYAVAIGCIAIALLAILDERGIFTIPSVLRWMLYGPMAIGILYIIGQSKDYKTALDGGVLGKIGDVSLEVYLVHIMVLHPFAYYGLMNNIGIFIYGLIPLISIPLAFLARRIEDEFKKRLAS